MKNKQEPLSFSLCAENIEYVKQEFQIRHRNRSHWMDDLLTHLRTKKQKVEGKAPRSKPKSYPSNVDEQFEILWDAKGKKGAKNGPRGAYNIFKRLAQGVDEQTCEAFTKMLIEDIAKNSGECGYPEMHLTTYLNQERWDR